MLIRLGYDIIFDTLAPVAIVALLKVHPSRDHDLREPDELHLEPAAKIDCYIDSNGNNCCRFLAPGGPIRLSNSTLIYDSGTPDPVTPFAREVPVQDLPTTCCAICSIAATAKWTACPISPRNFLAASHRMEPSEAVCKWVHQRVTFGYQFANAHENRARCFYRRFGVCRDFQHLAVTMCRALNIPARYATGYLGDIGVPPRPAAHGFQRVV